MQEEKKEKTPINAAEKEVNMSESPEDYKNVNQDAVVFSSEVEKPVRLTIGFKFLLGFGIFLSGIASLPAVLTFPDLLREMEDMTDVYEFTRYCRIMLFWTIIFLCFIMLVSIAISKRPFNRALYRLGTTIGIIITVSAFLFPRIEGYDANIRILSYEKHFVADGFYLIIGLLILVMALLMRYGYKYQSNSDMTI